MTENIRELFTGWKVDGITLKYENVIRAISGEFLSSTETLTLNLSRNVEEETSDEINFPDSFLNKNIKETKEVTWQLIEYEVHSDVGSIRAEVIYKSF